MFKKTLTFLLLCSTFSFVACTASTIKLGVNPAEQTRSPLLVASTTGYNYRDFSATNVAEEPRNNSSTTIIDLVVEKTKPLEGEKEILSSSSHAVVPDVKCSFPYQTVSLYCCGMLGGSSSTFMTIYGMDPFNLSITIGSSIGFIASCFSFYCHEPDHVECFELEHSMSHTNQCCDYLSVQNKDYCYCRLPMCKSRTQ